MKPPPGWVDDPTRPWIIPPQGPLHVATTVRPNVVVIMVDDLAEMDQRIWDRLPAIRSLFVDHGVRFTDYYGNDPLCCPGRANFLTGLYTDHHGVYTNNARLFDPSETVATELKAAGYETIIAGKYFNGTAALPQLWPPGWDHASISAGGYYYYLLFRNGVREYHDNDPNDYSGDVFSNDAVSFLRATPADKPVFAFLTPFGVHAGTDANAHRSSLLPVAANRFIGDPRCADIPPWHPANYDEADVSDKPSYIQLLKLHTVPLYADGWPMQPVCEALLSVDDEVARVVAELKAEGRFDDTLFLLTADNGMTFGAHRWDKKYVPYATQLPLYASWAAGRGTAPASSDAWLSNVDLAPTICQLAGCSMGPYPRDVPGQDGHSFLSLLTGTGPGPARDALYEEHRELGLRVPEWRAIRTTPASPLGLWHYIAYDDGHRELYDTSGGQCRDWQPGDPGDPCELDNLAGDPAYAVVQASLAARLASLIVHPLPSVP